MPLFLFLPKVSDTGLEVIGMGLKASGARLLLIIENVDVQQCMYLKWASARVKTAWQRFPTLKRSCAILSSLSHFLILFASLSIIRTRSKKDLFARSSENAAMFSRVL
jgi:hypothetical protein